MRTHDLGGVKRYCANFVEPAGAIYRFDYQIPIRADEVWRTPAYRGQPSLRLACAAVPGRSRFIRLDRRFIHLRAGSRFSLLTAPADAFSRHHGSASAEPRRADMVR